MSGFPEEWPKGGGGALCRDLDSAVRCPICGELFETPLSLRCGHACESRAACTAWRLMTL